MASTRRHYDLQLHLLGPFELVAGGRVIEIGSPKQRALLAVLALRPNRVVPVDSLIDELWAESPPPSVTATLQSLVSRLRRTLSVDRAGGSVALRGRDPGYVLEAEPGQVDVHRFEELATRGRTQLRRGDPEEAAARLQEALDLWRGPALGDLTEYHFARVEAKRLEEARLAVIEDLADAELAAGRSAEALALLEPHLAAQPLRERAWGELMLALYRMGCQAEALRTYQRVRGILKEQLGIEPTRALRDLEARILRHDPDLDRFTGAEPGLQDRQPLPGAASRPPPDSADTVALLFTDIVASTRRWEVAREEMAADLSLHDKLIVEACEVLSGHVFSHTGDGLAAAFPTAAAAIEAAVTAQQALHDQDWGRSEPLSVRMAVHAGGVECRAGNYFGPTVNRAARLLAIAFGGQILCSGAAADLARDQLPETLTLLDLGEHRLTDLVRPERIYQVSHARLPSAFPALRSVDTPRHNLPEALTSFVGRQDELDEIDALLSGCRLLTLTGVGGTGKTRLALRTAARAGPRFPDGVWLVELASLGEPGLVLPQVVAGLGILPGQIRPGCSLQDALCAHLRSRRLLVLLDNCEHLVDAVAPLVHAMLECCPGLTVLTTSREVLGVPGEVVFRVPPLSLPAAAASHPEDLAQSDAVTLFCDRARQAEPGFGLTPANAGAVARICRRLDGIPLALELAAARIRILGAQEVAERLDDRFRLLAGGARTSVARHQTLRAALDWSYDLLPASEQALLRRLAVFPASFTLEAAEVVLERDAGDVITGPGFRVLDLLSRLAEKSLLLVARDEFGVRYRLLETVREYARQRLAEAGESATAHRHHRDFFLGVVRQLSDGEWFPDSEVWARRIVADEDNFRAALAWSLDRQEDEAALQFATGMWIYWLLAGRSEGIDWLERALAAASGTDSPARVEALIGLSKLLDNSDRADPGRSNELVEEAFRVAERVGDGALHMQALAFLAERAMMRGDFARSEQLYMTALDRCPETNVRARGWCLYSLASGAVARGDRDLAAARLEEALALSSDPSLLTPHVLAALAPLVASAGDRERAERLIGEALAISERLQLPVATALVLTRATEARTLSGDTTGAQAALRQLLELLRVVGRRDFLADALEMAALLMTESSRRSEPAARLVGASQALRDVQAEPFGGSHVLSGVVRTLPGRLHETLGARRYETNTAEGRQMTLEEAICAALAEI